MFPCSAVKLEEAVSLEMDNHVMDKEEGCYNTEAAFSDDEEEVNNKGGNVTNDITNLLDLHIFKPAKLCSVSYVLSC